MFLDILGKKLLTVRKVSPGVSWNIRFKRRQIPYLSYISQKVMDQKEQLLFHLSIFYNHVKEYFKSGCARQLYIIVIG